MTTPKIAQYQSVQRQVEAAQVTADNMVDMAGWANGTVKTDQRDGKTIPYVQINAKTRNTRFGKAYEGDWIVKMGRSYRVYPDQEFKRNFETLYDIGTPLFDQIKRELEIAQVVQQPIETTAAELSDQFTKRFAAMRRAVDDGIVDAETMIRRAREEAGLPPLEEETIVGRPYVPTIEVPVPSEVFGKDAPMTNDEIAGNV